MAPTNCLEEERVIEVILDKKYMTRSVPAQMKADDSYLRRPESSDRNE